jgi:hypothetical protein
MFPRNSLILLDGAVARSRAAYPRARFQGQPCTPLTGVQGFGHDGEAAFGNDIL